MTDGIYFNQERKTWNVIYCNEWYFETADYEQAQEVYSNCCMSDADDYDADDYDADDYDADDYDLDDCYYEDGRLVMPLARC